MDKKLVKIKLKQLFSRLLDENKLGDNIVYSLNEDGNLEHNKDANIFINLDKLNFKEQFLRNSKINRISFDFDNLILTLENGIEINFDELNQDEIPIINEYLKE